MGHRVAAPVLVVDDEPSIIALLQTILEDEGFEVLGTGSGEQAIELMRGCRFQLVMADIAMPGMNGLELGDWIEVNAPGTPVLYMTGYTDLPLDGRRKVLHKPFTVSQILLAVQAAVAAS